METYLWHEQQSFKNLYESEIDILQRGLNGDFKLLKLFDPTQTEGRIVVIGELSFGVNQKQGIQIIFPTKYPFSSPKVISGTFNSDKDGGFMNPFQPKNFNKGNQYIDSSLCLFEKELWNKDEHNIGWVLRRAQKWLMSANSKRGFLKADIIEEYPALMQHSGQVLIPKEIKLPKFKKSGQFELTQFKHNYYIFEQNVLTEPTFTNNIGKEIFKWFRFKNEITLKKLFPKGLNGNEFLIILKSRFGFDIINSNVKNIAIYLPGDDTQWYFFKLIPQNLGNQINFRFEYFIARNISSELYLRTKDIFDDKILMGKRVTIIGVGAIGSEVAKSLAKNGVGNFNLFDMDTFEIGNSIRHAADLYYIGEKKTEVVKQLILRTNPNINVNTFNIDVLNDNGLLETALSESDLCIVLTAEDSVEYLINDHYINNYDIPFVFARASIGALSGAIQVVDSDSACLRCLSIEEVDKLPITKNKVKFLELKPEYGSCSSPPLPGSEIDTKEIALQVARVSIQCLMKKEHSNYAKLSHKQFYWHGPYGSKDQEPFTWEMKEYEKSKDCYICNK